MGAGDVICILSGTWSKVKNRNNKNAFLFLKNQTNNQPIMAPVI